MIMIELLKDVCAAFNMHMGTDSEAIEVLLISKTGETLIWGQTNSISPIMAFHMLRAIEEVVAKNDTLHPQHGEASIRPSQVFYYSILESLHAVERINNEYTARVYDERGDELISISGYTISDMISDLPSDLSWDALDILRTHNLHERHLK